MIDRDTCRCRTALGGTILVLLLRARAAGRDLLVGGLIDAEVDHLGYGPAVPRRDRHVRWSDIPVDNAFLIGVLDRVADPDEQRQTLPRAQIWFASQYSVMDTPRTNSITKYGRPVSVAPASKTFAMLG
jgi:hypothetical protein